MSLQAVNAHDAIRSLAIDPNEMQIPICARQQGSEFPHEQKARKRKELLNSFFRQCAAFCEGRGKAEESSAAHASDKENAEEPLRYWERPSWID